MKIGIMTLWWSQDNYGQLLQCYALQKYLCSKGHDAFLIQYSFQKDIRVTSFLEKCIYLVNPKIIFRLIKKIKNRKLLEKEIKENNRQFDEFRNRYIKKTECNYSTYYDLKNNPPVADIYIVGSDQVWNYCTYSLARYKNPLHAYFLDFGGKNIKRLSYAASWGKKEISNEYIKEISPLLQKFDYVSVREESGIELCGKCNRSDVDLVCDPTLLLNAETYRNIYRENEVRKPEGKYILFYFLNNECNFDIQTIYDFAKLNNLDVIYVTGNGKIDKYKKYYATIPEWLWLVDNAEYVITNSFHCSVFSILFHKKFGVIQLSGGAAGMNGRFDSLFDLMGIEKRYLYKNDFSILERDYYEKNVPVPNRFLSILK